MRRNGETNPVTILVLLLIAAGGFYAFYVAPLYMNNLTVREATGQMFNNYWLEGEDNAKKIFLARMNERERDVTHLEEDDDGAIVEKPGWGFTDDNIEFDFDQKTKELTVVVTYQRTVTFKPLKQFKTFTFRHEKKGKQLK